MTLERDQLSRLEQAYAALADRARSTGDCPAPELLWDAAQGALAAARTRELGAHVVTCPACIEAWRLAHQLLETGASADRPQRRVTPGGRRPLLVALAAAAVVTATALGLWTLRAERAVAPPPAYRAPMVPGIESALAPAAPIEREDAVLKWTGPVGARYDIDVATEDLTILASAAGLDATEFRVPAEALAALPPGTRIAWQVRASLPGGGTLRSRTFSCTLR